MVRVHPAVLSGAVPSLLMLPVFGPRLEFGFQAVG